MAKPWETFATSNAKPWENFKQPSPSAKQEIPSITDGMSTYNKLMVGIGQGMSSIGRGIGQLRNEQYDAQAETFPALAIPQSQRIGVKTQADIDRAKVLDKPILDTGAGKVGSVVGQAALASPAMFVPGANTYLGASMTGGAIGMTQPVSEGESRAVNTALGAGGGLLGQAGGRAIGNVITKRVAANKLAQAQNATRDATAKAAKDAGFKLPRSLYNPSRASNTLETFGGKAGTLQQASAKNQAIFNNKARQALDLPEDTALSVTAVERVRKQNYKPYEEIAAINTGAKNTLRDLKQARSDSSAWFNSYNRSANPEHLSKAQDLKQTADIAEAVLEDYANQAGKPQLVQQLKDARKMIAKTYTVERAMNQATGDINGRVIGRMFDKGKPLSGGLEDIGQFAAAFPKAAQPSQMSAGAGISALDPLAGAGYGALGSAVTGNPTGLLAAGIPMLRSPARSMALSSVMQKSPIYGGKALNAASRISPLLPYVGTMGGALTATN